MDPFTAPVKSWIEFLTTLFQSRGVGYSMLNTARSALSLILEPHHGITFGKHPLVQRFIKGVFRLRPSLPKYTFTYDAIIVLKYLREMDPPDKISLRDMSRKLAMLLCLLSGQRDQALPSMDITRMQLTEDKCTFIITDLMKTSRPGKHIPPIELKSYPLDHALCPVTLIRHYLSMTQKVRGMFIKLFVSYKAPHKPAPTSTLARWCRYVLRQAGISDEYASHSTRSAASSKAYSLGMSLSEINKAAGWSSSSVFEKYYNKPIQDNLGEYLLSALE